MAKSPKGYLGQVASKLNKIDRSHFNLLENLLIFKVLDNLSVPAESGVEFRISRNETDEQGICLLIRIDDSKDPVVANHELRPDYLSLYLSGEKCICTIIEMKGRGEEDAGHGLEQIKAFYYKLRLELKKHLSAKFEIEIQGILLTAYGSQVPAPKIAKLRQEGLTVLPVQYNNRAELFPYISKRVDLTERYAHRNCRQPRKFSELEGIFSSCAMSSSIEPRSEKIGMGAFNGIHVDYALSHDGYATLTARNREIKLTVSTQDQTRFDRIRDDLEASGLDSKILLERIEPLPLNN